jgi:hypothetical protein
MSIGPSGRRRCAELQHVIVPLWNTACDGSSHGCAGLHIASRGSGRAVEKVPPNDKETRMTGSEPLSPDDAESFALLAQSIKEARPNVMLVGAPAAASRIVGTLGTDLRERIVEGRAAEPEAWPRDGASIVLRDIERLDLAQQQHLIEWLNRQSRRTHLITVVGRSLYPDVKRGKFLDTLFYRLNVVQLPLS